MSPAPLPASTDWVPLGSAGIVGFADEVAYGERQANVATAAAAGFANGADLLATALSFTADGATAYMVEFYVPSVTNGGAANYTGFSINLDGAQYGKFLPGYGAFNAINAYGRQKIVPSAGVHTLNIRMYSEGAWISTAYGGTGGSNNCNPIFVRLTRVSPYTPPGANPVSYATTLPASPVDGQEAILVDSITNPTYQWRFRYNAGSTSAYKWEFVGGAPWQGEVDATSTSNNSAFADPSGGVVTLTLPRAGDYQLEYGADLGITTATANCQISLAPYVGTTPATVDIANIFSLTAFGAFNVSVARARKKLGIAASTVVKLQWAVGGGNVQSMYYQWMRITPVRVS